MPGVAELVREDRRAEAGDRLSPPLSQAWVWAEGGDAVASRIPSAPKPATPPSAARRSAEDNLFMESLLPRFDPATTRPHLCEHGGMGSVISTLEVPLYRGWVAEKAGLSVGSGRLSALVIPEFEIRARSSFSATSETASRRLTHLVLR